MVRTSTFSMRLTTEQRRKLERYAEKIRMKPSALAALVLTECIDEWIHNYVKGLAETILEDE